MGELCHFLGREFVCGIFTWPAGGDRGILFGYDVDRESAEYAVEDLVKLIRIIAGTPGLERIHFIAHSRGTDTLASALAALECRGLCPEELARARVSHRQRRPRRSRPRWRRRGHQDLQGLFRPGPALRRRTRAGRDHSAVTRAQAHLVRIARRQGAGNVQLAVRKHRTGSDASTQRCSRLTRSN